MQIVTFCMNIPWEHHHGWPSCERIAKEEWCFYCIITDVLFSSGGLRQQMLDDGWISELELQFAEPPPSEQVFDLKGESAAQWADEIDDHTGAQLPGDLVHAGKLEENRWGERDWTPQENQ